MARLCRVDRLVSAGHVQYLYVACMLKEIGSEHNFGVLLSRAYDLVTKTKDHSSYTIPLVHAELDTVH